MFEFFETKCRIIKHEDVYHIQTKKWYQREWHTYKYTTESHQWTIGEYKTEDEATSSALILGFNPDISNYGKGN